MHPPDRRLNLFFSDRNNDRAPARQTTRTFYFSVVIMITHPPDRRLELFFSGRNNDRAPARQTTVSFFPVVIRIVHPPDRQLDLFFFLVTIAHPPDRRLELFFNEFTWRNQFLLVIPSPNRINLEEPISSGYPAHIGLTWRNQFLLVTQPI